MEKFEFLQNVIEGEVEIPDDSILSRMLVQNDALRLIRFDFAPGQELSEHTAAKHAVLHFLSGEANVTLGEEVKQVTGNSWVYMEPHLPHSIKAKTRVVMLLMMFGV